MIAFLLSLVLQISVGILCVWLIVRQSNPRPALMICLGVAAGIGIASSIYFTVLLVAATQAQFAWWLCESLLLALLISIWRFFPSGNSPESAQSQAHPLTPTGTAQTKLSKIVFAVTGLIATSSFWAQIWLHPHSDWDALMIWNVRARFFERAPLDIANAFNNLLFWSHPDYPLLIPAIVSFGLTLTSENQFAPAAIAFLFTITPVLLLVASLELLVAPMAGLLAGTALFTTPFWIKCGASMLADVPIALYFLSTLICLSLYDREKHPGYLALSGMFASMAAWTKNEGLLFILCLIVASAIASGKIRLGKQAIVALIAGALPFLILLAWFKISLAPPNDLVSGQGGDSTLARLLNLSRYVIVGQYFVVYAVTFGCWLVSPIPLLCLMWFSNYAKLTNVTNKRAILTVVLMLFGYATIYLVTPADLQVHLITSADRLILQLWPCFIFAFASCFTSEAFAEKSSPETAV